MTKPSLRDRPEPSVHLPVGRMDAVIFDMDGVVTDTARIHAGAWAVAFNQLLSTPVGRSGSSDRPFSDDDYLDFVDGKPRLDGVEAFLASRALQLPRGTPTDAPGLGSVCALGRLKDREFELAVERQGVSPFPSTVALLHALTDAGVTRAVISSSRHLPNILAAAGVADLFDASVDGADAGRLGLPGKPDPAIFLEAAHRLDVDPARSVVVEDSVAGVEAGRRGDFLLVVGIDRAGRPERTRQLRQHGADVVVGDLAEVDVAGHVPPDHALVDPGE